MKWMIKRCHHYGYLSQDRVGARRFRYSADTGNTIWGLAEVFRQGIEEKFGKVIAERLREPFMGLEKPIEIEMGDDGKDNRINRLRDALRAEIACFLGRFRYNE